MSPPTEMNAAPGADGNPAQIAATPSRSQREPPIPTKIVQTTPLGTEALILNLLEDPPSAKTIEVMNALWTTWGITGWDELALFLRKDVDEFFAVKHSDTPLALRKKIRYVVEFAKNNDLNEGTTLRMIIDYVDDKDADDSSAKVTVSSAESEEKKKTVPALEKFTGQDEDYFTWRDTVINDLGRNGLGKFVLDKDAHHLYGGQSESVFYALRSALSGGLASSHADSLYEGKNYNPFALWKALREYYDTTLNRANVNKLI